MVLVHSLHCNRCQANLRLHITYTIRHQKTVLFSACQSQVFACYHALQSLVTSLASCRGAIISAKFRVQKSSLSSLTLTADKVKPDTSPQHLAPLQSAAPFCPKYAPPPLPSGIQKLQLIDCIMWRFSASAVCQLAPEVQSAMTSVQVLRSLSPCCVALLHVNAVIVQHPAY